MKFNKYFMLGLAGLAFAACSNDEDITNQKDGDKVLLTLSLGRTEQTRAVETSAAGRYNNVKSISIHFYTADDRRLDIIRTPDEQTAYDKEINNAISELNSGTVTSDPNLGNVRATKIAITGVPETATQVYVVMNENTPISTGNLSQARSSVIRLAGLVEKADENCVFNQQNSLMTGLATIGATNEEGIASADVAVTPVSSRLEIKKFTAVKSTVADAMNIANFSLKGIYVNRFYETGTLDPQKNADAADRTKKDYLSIKGNYTEENYTKDKVAFMCDEYTEPLSSIALTTGGICEVNSPEANKNWGYPVLAGKQELLPEGVYDVANIVVCLSVNIESVGIRDKYLTIVGYKNATTNAAIQRFDRRNVYIIENLQFSIDDLTDVPYEGTKTVEATVKVQPWVGVPVTPEFN